MKRFLILSILIVFVAVSCAGPSKVGWTKPDFRQDQFEKDRKECFDSSVDKGLNPEAFGKAIEECLEKQGYEKKPQSNEPPVGIKVLRTVGEILLIILLLPGGAFAQI